MILKLSLIQFMTIKSAKYFEYFHNKTPSEVKRRILTQEDFRFIQKQIENEHDETANDES